MVAAELHRQQAVVHHKLRYSRGTGERCTERQEQAELAVESGPEAHPAAHAVTDPGQQRSAAEQRKKASQTRHCRYGDAWHCSELPIRAAPG